YALSFFLPTFAIGAEREVNYGYVAFCVAFLSPFNPFFGGLRAFIPWLANPMLWFGVYYFVTGRCRLACFSGVTAIAMSATLFLFNDPENRALLLIGYYVWFNGMGLFTLAAGIKWAGNAQEGRKGVIRHSS